MALIQAVLSLISRSVGKILTALFDWAVVALFGRVSGRRRMLLSGLVASAAAWPLLLAGVVAPKAAAFFLAFVPLPDALPAWLVRLVWIALALFVPVAIGAGLRPPPAEKGGTRPGLFRSVLRGFPITAGLALAFLVLLVTVPVLRVASALCGRQDVHVPLVTTPASYPAAAALIAETLRRHDIAVVALRPPWWSALPTRILTHIAGGALSGLIAAESAYFRAGKLELALYPNALLLRGPVEDSARAHVLVVEALSGRPDMFQTLTAEAQDLERQIQRVWAAYRRAPEAHRNAWALRSRLDAITAEMSQQPLSFDEWQVVYRQVLQVERALAGKPQLLEERLLGKDPVMATSMAPTPDTAAPADNPRALSTMALTRRILTSPGSLLVHKEVELARAELAEDVHAALGMVKLFGAAALLALFALNLVLLALVLALAAWLPLPGWTVALGLGTLLLALAAVLGGVGWSRRVQAPLDLTRKTVKEDMHWAKERLA
jgi:uncharacterized membrane protein YqjE